MLTHQRKQLILQRLQRDGIVVATELGRELATSEDTIRRDLRELARDGLLTRVHGGALPASQAAADLGSRRTLHTDEKMRLARAATGLIHPGQVVILDGGTTTSALARAIPVDMPLTVITHSPGIAVELADHHLVDVVLLGGRLFRHSMVTLGASAAEAASRIRADLYFMGATGIHAEAGVTTADFEEAAMKRLLHERAAETVVIASPEKLGAASAFQSVPASAIATLVVAAEASEAAVDPIEALGVTVLRASQASGR